LNILVSREPAAIIAVSNHVRFAFGECVLDSGARELRRGKRHAELSPKAFELLILLLRARPRALAQAEIRDHLWPGVFVSYTSLARLVTEVRHAIGDDPRNPSFVRTLHGFGYAFQGEAQEAETPSPAPGSAFALLWGNKVFGLRPGETVLGRSLDCTLQIPSSKTSRRHARIVVSDRSASLEDLGSKHGTWLNDRRIDALELLADNDQIGVGNAVLTFRVVSSQAETE
jgi:DNA-binding winged helix-turn-helix (wHTH) protein